MGWCPRPASGATRGNMALRVVLSGCSGGGKSTLLARMRARGWTCFDEPGRRVVAEGLSPYAEPEAFARRCIALAEADFDAAPDGMSLYDRSILDAGIWFLRMRGRLPEDLADLFARRRYARSVFLVPPWPEIHVRDAARQHGLDAALAEYRALCDRLPGLGYTPQIVPRLPVAARADWLTARLQALRERADDTGQGI